MISYFASIKCTYKMSVTRCHLYEPVKHGFRCKIYKRPLDLDLFLGQIPLSEDIIQPNFFSLVFHVGFVRFVSR